jgi:ABC-2 type transport system permease protein
VVSLIVLSTLRSLISVFPVAMIAFLLFHFNLFSLGAPLIAFILCLLMSGWWLGFIAISVVIQFGSGAEMLAWMMTYAAAPLCAAFYPVAILPAWLQPAAFLMPASHVFEGMRAIITQNRFDVPELLWAFGLNLLYLALSIVILLLSLRGARQRGALLVVGE